MKATRSVWRWGAIAVAAVSLGVAGPALAKIVHVEGLQTPVDDTHATMAGGLLGRWTTDSFTLKSVQPEQGTFQATGEEHFDGCVDANESGVCDRRDPTGTLFFSYVFFGKVDLATGALVSGRCIHPVTGGTGGFRHAGGILLFEDDIAAGTSSYVGRIEYRRQDVRPAERTTMSRTHVANELGSVRGCA